ncbi:hypothetical protein ACMBCN_03000 [Candidatus Liberibacter asiaticus]|nr:hypothetical protein [Candidatus Liberibacter asiaticus]
MRFSTFVASAFNICCSCSFFFFFNNSCLPTSSFSSFTYSMKYAHEADSIKSPPLPHEGKNHILAPSFGVHSSYFGT